MKLIVNIINKNHIFRILFIDTLQEKYRKMLTRNLLIIISEFYNYHLIANKIIYSLINDFVKVKHAENIYYVIKHSNKHNEYKKLLNQIYNDKSINGRVRFLILELIEQE